MDHTDFKRTVTRSKYTQEFKKNRRTLRVTPVFFSLEHGIRPAGP
ncbi:hypothetical protein ACVC7V_09980 [Hydrogenophaga sp. A37]|nr:hypothetical protein [Hydrogenophaga sp. A37]